VLKLSIVLTAFSLLAASRIAAQPNRPVPAALPSIALPPELDRVLRDYERQWQARSAAGLAELFVEDGFVLQSGRPPVRGRAGIIDAYRMAGGPLALRAVAFSVADSIGFIIGAYAGAPAEPDAGKFILLLRREPGRPWRIVADMDNGNGAR
jgi:ketosteroid isomerase-like protein